MPRPKCLRRIRHSPPAFYFKPRGIPLTSLEETVLAPDELEAVRLADFERLYHEQAAEKMRISRATFGRILESAHHKIAGALVHGRALRLGGREAVMSETRAFICNSCTHTWDLPFGTGRPVRCPSCKSTSISRRAPQGRRHRGNGAGNGRHVERNCRP